MELVSWTRKLAQHKFRKYHRILSIKSSAKSQEEILEADLSCIMCQKKVADAISRINDIESMEFHVLEKKVILRVRESVCQSEASSSKCIITKCKVSIL